MIKVFRTLITSLQQPKNIYGDHKSNVQQPILRPIKRKSRRSKGKKNTQFGNPIKLNNIGANHSAATDIGFESIPVTRDLKETSNTDLFPPVESCNPIKPNIIGSYHSATADIEFKSNAVTLDPICSSNTFPKPHPIERYRSDSFCGCRIQR